MQKQTEIQKVFNFNPSNQRIRVEIIESEPWFVATDVCKILNHTNPSVAVQMLDEDERCKKSLRRDYQCPKKSLGRDYQQFGNDEAWLVNESGLYNLIFRSNRPEAKAFRKWVTSEVLPAIRKHGKYEPWQNGAIMYYNPANNRELVENFCDIATREIVKITNTRQRVRLFNLVEFMRSKIQ